MSTKTFVLDLQILDNILCQLTIKFLIYSPYCSSLDAVGDSQSLVDILSKYCSSKTVMRSVCSFYGIIYVFELQNLLDWAEYLMHLMQIKDNEITTLISQ